MFAFNDSESGGFLVIGRDNVATALLACESIRDLEDRWPEMLAEAATWRANRGRHAKTLALLLVVPPALGWDATVFITGRVVGAPDAPAPELRGLAINVTVSDVNMIIYLNMTVFTEPTCKPAPIDPE